MIYLMKYESTAELDRLQVTGSDVLSLRTEDGHGELQPIATSHWSNGNDPSADHLAVTGEGEFTEFVRAVTELFGPEQATQSAEDWLNEVASKHSLPAPRSIEWRLVTLAAFAQLTIRLTVDLQR
jgi:hypothetical protein